MNSMVEKFYELIILHSENGMEKIEHPGFLVNEASKVLGVPRAVIIELLLKMEDVSFLERTSNEDYSWTVKRMMTLSELKELLLNHL